MIKKVTIKNFRGFKEVNFQPEKFTLFIGDNQTGKTSILEAINFALSPYFLSGRIKHTDFYNGLNESIGISLKTDEFDANLPDGYAKQKIKCKGVNLEIKKRERSAPNKAFNELAVITHYYLPIFEKVDGGWKIKRQSGTDFSFDERLLSLNVAEAEFLRSFYFSKERDRQIVKGFNSSFSTVVEEFNWRFLKKLQENNQIISDKTSLENQILEKAGVTKGNDVITLLNNKLKNIGLEEITLNFIDSQAPFDSAFFSRKFSNLDLQVKYLGSGIEMIISLLFLETLASYSKEKLVVLIDEPELHLHPLMQIKLAEYLFNLSKKHQIFVSTHSPVFFKEVINKENVKVFITRKSEDGMKVENIVELQLFPWSPSWGEMNFFAYDLPTVEFHNELYGYLQEITKNYNQADFDNFLSNNGISKCKKWIPERDGILQKEQDVTLQTFIRNKIHHPENKIMQNENFTLEDLNKSISGMINIIQSMKK